MRDCTSPTPLYFAQRRGVACSCRRIVRALSKQLKHIRALARYHAAVPRQFVLADHSTRAEHTADDLRRATAHEGRWRLVESPGRIPRALSFSGAGGSTNAAKVIGLRADRWRQSPALARATAVGALVSLPPATARALSFLVCPAPRRANRSLQACSDIVPTSSLLNASDIPAGAGGPTGRDVVPKIELIGKLDAIRARAHS